MTPPPEWKAPIIGLCRRSSPSGKFDPHIWGSIPPALTHRLQRRRGALYCLHQPPPAGGERRRRSRCVAALEKRGDKALVGNTGYRRFHKTVGDHFAIDRAKAAEDASSTVFCAAYQHRSQPAGRDASLQATLGTDVRADVERCLELSAVAGFATTASSRISGTNPPRTRGAQSSLEQRCTRYF